MKSDDLKELEKRLKSSFQICGYCSQELIFAENLESLAKYIGFDEEVLEKYISINSEIIKTREIVPALFSLNIHKLEELSKEILSSTLPLDHSYFFASLEDARRYCRSNCVMSRDYIRQAQKYIKNLYRCLG